MKSDPNWDLCAQLAVRFWGHVDRREYSALMNLLTKDARWERQGRWYTGHREIMGSLDERPQQLLVRHLVSNMIAKTAGDSVDCQYYLTVLASDDAGGTAPAELHGIRLMGEVSCRLRRSGPDLQFCEILAVPVFRSAH